MRYHDFNSIEGLDRFQEYVTDDIHMKDRRLAAGVLIGYHFPETPIIFVVSHERIDRRGFMGDHRRRGIESRVGTGFHIKLD